MVKAYEKIADWFSQNSNSVEHFKQHLETKVRFIWYEVEPEENDIEIFERLNIGKIPLNDMELVKALFLASYSGADEKEIDARARCIYDTERKLRNSNDKIYSLYSNTVKKYEHPVPDDISRSEILLNGFIQGESTTKKYKVFSVLFKIFRNEPTKVDEEWRKFKDRSKLFLYIGDPSSANDRFKIRKIYHYIGYLICCDIKNIQDIWAMWDGTKGYDGLLQDSKSIIIEKLKKIPDIGDLYYNDKKIFNILLLFNLETLNLEKSNERDFEFNKFKLMNWSIEHIHSQKSGPIGDEKKEDWLKTILLYYEDSKHQNLADYLKKKMNKKNIKEEELNELIEKVKDEFDSLPEMNIISNLALLDARSNSSFKNAIFSVKRKRVEKLKCSDRLIPHCTGKVFNKDYSKKKDNPDFWSKNDRDDYFEKIQEIIGGIIGGQNE